MLMAIDSIEISALLQDENGNLPDRNRDKAKVFNAFFASVFCVDDEPRGSQCPELRDCACENDQLPVNSEILQDLLLQLDPYRSMRPDGIQSRILKDLAGVMIKSLSMIFVWSWESREVLADWKLVNIVCVFKKGKKEESGNYKPVSFTSVLVKIMEKIIVGSIEKHLKDSAVTGHYQHGFRKSPVYQT
ncbi:rna-directed dna polymerase from mobile element jockey-like [Pitangus sulphuratus]|nr:rna-directed dna polymerase from mobile element jockey-like [Pitangus sulphuratus]